MSKMRIIYSIINIVAIWKAVMKFLALIVNSCSSVALLGRSIWCAK